MRFVSPTWDALSMTGIVLNDLDWVIACLRRIRKFPPEGDYFALTLSVDHSGSITWSCESWWVGKSSRRPKDGHWEVREASLTDPQLKTNAWANTGQQWVAVDDDEQLSIFLRLGGNALVEASLAQRRLASVVGSHECVRDGLDESGFPDIRGYVAFSDVSEKAVTERAPRRKLRMRVLERDGFRCVICGRRPRDYVDLELHVHHLIPWRLSGPTALDNLVTLCGNCHKGLDPDFEPKLRELAGLPGPVDTWDFGNVELDKGVERYRQLLTSICDDPETLVPLWLLSDRAAAQHSSYTAGSGRDRFIRELASSNRLSISWTTRRLTDALYPPSAEATPGREAGPMTRATAC